MKARDAEPGRERWPGERQDGREQEAPGERDEAAGHGHGNGVRLLADHRQCDLVAERRHRAEDRGECCEHGEHAELLGPVEPGEQRRDQDQKALAEDGAAREDGEPAREPALGQEAPQMPDHAGTRLLPRG